MDQYVYLNVTEQQGETLKTVYSYQMESIPTHNFWSFSLMFSFFIEDLKDKYLTVTIDSEAYASSADPSWKPINSILSSLLASRRVILRSRQSAFWGLC